MKFFILFLLSVVLYGTNTKTEEIKANYLLSYNYEQTQKYTESIKVLSPLYKKYPNDYTLNLRFGWLFFLDKKYNNSIKYYQHASLVKPYALEPQLGLARTYLTTYSFEDAENICEHILKIDNHNYYANLYLSKALIAQKKYTIALNVINKMVVLYPTDVTFLEQLARVYKLQKNKNLQQVYDNILMLDPNNVLVKSNQN